MVKSRHLSGIRQCIVSKPQNFGLILWVVAHCCNPNTYDFHVYVGKEASRRVGVNGLGYDVVTRLTIHLLDQGYQVFVDNFCTFPILFKDLFQLTTPVFRWGFPDCMNKGKGWAKEKKEMSGDTRWVRDNVYSVMQWKDNGVVTLLTAINNAKGNVKVTRRHEDNGRWVKDDMWNG